ncbi:uncharacterized protein F4812DRAFT_453872 [Daldinia caldariorum]|uniref:uncharacterized protein n=1 Tax=Daldinia caldariorum TaxID=326644 RepID=UPI0020078F6D|nr:uncharacterized protein F4812DRAFT_453872 [Daldinia caldariorum]KAI1462984.1 hypothetical protein F4812DRAFT_453872 [Daldinia caldariorum]
MHPNSRVALAAQTDPCPVCPGGHFHSLHITESPAPQAYPYKGDLEVPSLFRSTRWLPSRHKISPVPRAQPSSPTAAMDRLHPLESMRLAIQKALPTITVESVSPLPSCRLLRFFSIKISDGRALVLSLPPPPTLRLLRSERGLNLSETLLTKWMLEGVLEPPSKTQNAIQGDIGLYQHVQIRPGEVKPEISSEKEFNWRQDVLKFLPVLVAHVPSSAELGAPFNIFEPARGVTIGELPMSLTASERQTVDFQKGQLVRQLSSFVSPNGLFGPATAVVSPQLPSTDLHAAQLANLGLRSSRTWKQTFHSLLESVLRDAEDMAVTISYEPIRNYFNRLSYLLDGVTTARLVILDASDDLNVLVSRASKQDMGKDKDGDDNKLLATAPEAKHTKTEDISERKAIPEYHHHQQKEQQQQTIAVTGLRDWSNSVFGDPLFAETFSQDPSADFSRGFFHSPSPSPSSSSPSLPSSSPPPPPPNTPIDDPDTAPVRLLLYECYHATVGVVQQFYRPGPASSDREIAARRRLAAALKRLDEVEGGGGGGGGEGLLLVLGSLGGAEVDSVGKRARRPSANVEAWPVKKTKAEGEGEGDTSTSNAGSGSGSGFDAGGGRGRGRGGIGVGVGVGVRIKEEEEVYESIEKDEDIHDAP